MKMMKLKLNKYNTYYYKLESKKLKKSNWREVLFKVYNLNLKMRVWRVKEVVIYKQIYYLNIVINQLYYKKVLLLLKVKNKNNNKLMKSTHFINNQ